MGKTKIKVKNPTVRPLARAPDGPPDPRPALTGEQKQRVKTLIGEGVQIADPYAQSIVNDLRQTVADHQRTAQYIDQLEREINGAHGRLTKLQGQIDGLAQAITRLEDIHGPVDETPAANNPPDGQPDEQR